MFGFQVFDIHEVTVFPKTQDTLSILFEVVILFLHFSLRHFGVENLPRGHL